MTPDPRDRENGATGQFDYFVLRLQRSPGAPAELRGVVERLGTGEKRSFDTAEHLVRLVTAWPNMQT